MKALWIQSMEMNFDESPNSQVCEMTVLEVYPSYRQKWINRGIFKQYNTFKLSFDLIWFA